MTRVTLMMALASLAMAGCADEKKVDEQKAATEADPAPTVVADDPIPEVEVARRPVVFKTWDVEALYALEEEEEEEEEDEEGETSGEGRFGDPDIDPMRNSGTPGGEVGTPNWTLPSFPGEAVGDFALTPENVRTIQLQARFERIDRAAQNRYGDMRIRYSPGTAKVTVAQYIYKERIESFVARTTRAGADQRVLVEKRALTKFETLTTGLPEGQSVHSLNVRNLPLASRSNPKDTHDPSRAKHCTDDPKDFCTFEYVVTVRSPEHAPQRLLLTHEFARHPPGVTHDEPISVVRFAKTGPGVWEAVWPSVRLKPAAEGTP